MGTYRVVSAKLPVLGNVEGPLEGQMGLLVVVDEVGSGIVVAASQHARGGILLLDCKRGQN